MVAVTIKTAATVARLVKVAPAVLRLTAMLTVLSNLFVKIFLCFVNTLLTVSPMVCL